MKPKLSIVLKLGAVVGLIAGMIWFNQSYLELTPADIRTWILSFGWVAPLLYILLYTVRPLILFPASVLSLAGGLAFGALWGTVLTVIGATAGAIVSFFVARFMGKSLVKMEWKGSFSKIQHQLEKRGLLYVLLLRLIPLFPFDLISYIAGVSKIRFRAFLTGTFFGIIPGTFAYNFLGSSFADGDPGKIAIAAAVFLLALIIPLLFRKRLEGEIQ
ncbi:TVP38/TMEM64 family protein [Marinicrinis sediminis]|uniref:TVP38/TMEM64 family membrane protein n=1 Tax=Marinicrinis sediminis TaxID=1652465 RepID=A0ABW5RDW4_9BACL